MKLSKLVVGEIYINLVKLILVITIVVSGTSFISNIVDYYFDVGSVETFYDYKMYYTDNTENLSETEIKQKYESYKERQLELNKNTRMSNIVESSIVLLISILVLLFISVVKRKKGDNFYERKERETREK